MYLVLHEVAITVKQNPEDYRALFTASDEKQLVHVRHDHLILGSPSPWHEMMGLFYTALAERCPQETMDQMFPTFSTHTVASQAGTLVAFMDAASPFFSYRCTTRCGLPSIRLLGCPEDYRKLLLASTELAKMFDPHLKDYFDHLLPVLATIAAQAAGAPYDEGFWSSLYKHFSGSGTDDMTGWISAFLNYGDKQEGLVPKEGKFYDWKATMDQSGWKSAFPRDEIPAHVSRTPFVWDYYGKEMKMELIGGVLSVQNIDGFLTPQLGFGIIHAD